MWSTPSTGRSVWDNGETFSNQYHEKHGEIIESMGMGTVMIDEDKPLLRKPKNNSPASAASNNSQVEANWDTNNQNLLINSPTASLHDVGIDDTTTTVVETHIPSSDSKSHIRQFQVRGNQFSDYQFSGTSDSDDNFIVTSSSKNNNSKDDNGYDLDEIDELVKLEKKLVNNNDKTFHENYASKNISSKKTKNKMSPAISGAGKRMIMNGLGHKAKHNQQYHEQHLSPPCESQHRSYYSSSPTSSVDTNEFPTLRESQRQASIKSSPGKSKQSTSSSSNSSLFHAERDNNSPNGQTVKAMGRGQILKRLTEQSRVSTTSSQVRRLSPALCAISAPRSIAGVNSAYDFPSDEELLDTPHVVPVVVGAPVVGKNVNVLKRFNK